MWLTAFLKNKTKQNKTGQSILSIQWWKWNSTWPCKKELIMNPSLLYVARRLVNYYNSQSECVYTKAMPRWAFRQRDLCGTTTQGSSWCGRVAAGFKVKGKRKRWSPVWRLIKHTSDTQRCTPLRPVVQLSLAEQNNINATSYSTCGVSWNISQWSNQCVARRHCVTQKGEPEPHSMGLAFHMKEIFQKKQGLFGYVQAIKQCGASTNDRFCTIN